MLNRSYYALLGIVFVLFLGSGSVFAKKKNQQEVREVSSSYSDCVVKKRPGLARAAILSNAKNEVIVKKYRRLIIGKCLVKANRGSGGRMSFGGDHFRYSLAGALIRMDLQNYAPHSFKDVPRLSHYEPIQPNAELMVRKDRKGKKYRKRVASAKSARVLSIYGECVVRNDPINSHSLVMSEVGSTDEATSFMKLQPSFGPCVDGDGEFRFDKSVLRGLVNVNYYRLAMASVTPVARSAEASN